MKDITSVVDKDVKNRTLLCTVDGNVNWYCHYGKQYGDFFKNYKKNYHLIQHSLFWAFIQSK